MTLAVSFSLGRLCTPGYRIEGAPLLHLLIMTG